MFQKLLDQRVKDHILELEEWIVFIEHLQDDRKLTDKAILQIDHKESYIITITKEPNKRRTGSLF